MTRDPDLVRHLDAFRATHKLDTAHQTVLSYLHLEPPRPAADAALNARSWAKLTRKTVQTVSDYESAISDMRSRDLLWEIDAAKRSLITDNLNADAALGPTEGIPALGTLQFSIRFADLLDDFWKGIDCECPGVVWSRDWQSEKRHLIYSPTRAQCLEFLHDELSDDDIAKIEHLSGPQACGPWRAKWWRKYESGYVLEVRYL